MRLFVIPLALAISACSTSTSTPISFCSSTAEPAIINSEPQRDYKVCGNILVTGHAVNNAAELNQYLIKEGQSLRADAVVLLRKSDSFTAAEGRVIKADAIAIQYK